MPSSPAHVFVICETTASGHINLVEAHTTQKAALEAAKKLPSFAEVKELPLKKMVKDGEGKVKTPNKIVEYAAGEDELAGDDDGSPEADDEYDNGIPSALQGLKVLFTGTMEKPRKKCEEIAESYGATIVKKLEDTHYVVIGTKPGAKKVAEIKEKNLDTIKEADFFNMLYTGIPVAKRHQMYAEAQAAQAVGQEPPKKKQKKN